MEAVSDNVFGKRLRQARRMRGWSLAELRDHIDNLVSLNALSKYERGASMASSGVLIALSKALDVSLDYLFREFELDLERVRFRKLTSLPKKQQHQITEEARDFFERYYEIEHALGIDSKFTSPVQPAQNLEVEKMAEKVREEWEIGNAPIPNVHALLESNGIKVWYDLSGRHDFDGFSAETDFGPVIVVAKKTAARCRMTALHELAHILSKHLELDEKDEEKFVQRFTGALLLPEEPLKAMLGNSRSRIPVGELLEIKKQYGISMGGIIMRARDAGIINQKTCADFFRFGPGKKWRSERKEPWDEELRQSFPEDNSRFRQLVFRAYGEETITLSQVAGYLNCSTDEADRLLNAPMEITG